MMVITLSSSAPDYIQVCGVMQGHLKMMLLLACILDAIVVNALILVRNWGDMFLVPLAFIFYMGYFTCADHGCRYSYRGLRAIRNMRRDGIS